MFFDWEQWNKHVVCQITRNINHCLPHSHTCELEATDDLSLAIILLLLWSHSEF